MGYFRPTYLIVQHFDKIYSVPGYVLDIYASKYNKLYHL